MGVVKWIGGVLGWVVGGPIGAIVGFLLGSLFQNSGEYYKRIENGDWTGGHSTGGQSAGGSTYRRTTTGTNTYGQRNSFMVCMLVLSSAVIRADGKYMHSEMEYLRKFISTNFGEDAVDDAMKIFLELKDKQINIYEVGGQISNYMNYSQRLQLFHYLVDLAKADGSVCNSELDTLKSIAGAIGLTSSDRDSILSMFETNTVESAYTILEISPSATDDEVKKAYKRMAMKNHPDKVASLGPEVQKVAEEKFKKIQEAYETIKKERNM